MNSSKDTQQYSLTSPTFVSAPSQLCVDMKKETLNEGTVCVKKEETLELSIDNHEIDFSNIPDVICIKDKEDDDIDCLYCEICKSFFFKKCEVHGPVVFIPDTSVPMGVSDRAKQTLPLGLEIAKSSIPDAGLGVFNKGEIVPVGTHFGPYEGELVDKEKAMNSGYAWVIKVNKEYEEYIDAVKEKHANWMRYVNCARNDEEQNLVAFQYREEILYRCCRPIYPGQELLVWYEEEYAKELTPAFDQLWNNKCSANGLTEAPLQVLYCSLCPFTYTSQTYLEKHIRRCHYKDKVSLQKSDEIKYEIETTTKSSTSSGTLNCFTASQEVQKQIPHCLDCGKAFTHQNALKAHRCIHAREKPHHCSQCGRSFIRKSHLQLHYRIHTGEKPYHCLQCGKNFTRKYDLQVHQRIHTGEKPYKCSECGKLFTHQSDLLRHQRIHRGEKPYHCSQCEKSFTHQSDLQRHQNIHTGEKPYRCSQCGKCFTYWSALQKHHGIHTGEKQYHCSQCEKSFTHQSALKRHQHVHTGDKPYQCSQCGKRFAHQSVLQRHKYIHTGEKPYHCSQCKKGFIRKTHLQVHQFIHTGEKPYQCSQCRKSFNHPSALQHHQGIHTGEKPYQCVQCGKTFTHQSALRRHQRIHSGEKPYKCSQCGKCFTRQTALHQHQHIHTGEKPYHCSLCGKSFTYQSALNRHRSIHSIKKLAPSITAHDAETEDVFHK